MTVTVLVLVLVVLMVRLLALSWSSCWCCHGQVVGFVGFVMLKVKLLALSMAVAMTVVATRRTAMRLMAVIGGDHGDRSRW